MSMSQSLQSQKDKLVCYKCKGIKQYNSVCKICANTGYLSDRFNSEILHKIKEYIDQSVPQAFTKLNQCLSLS